MPTTLSNAELTDLKKKDDLQIVIVILLLVLMIGTKCYMVITGNNNRSLQQKSEINIKTKPVKSDYPQFWVKF